MFIAIIPAFLSRPREPDQLSRCVAAVLAQPRVQRVVVVDDGSPLPIPALPSNAEVLHQPANAGPAAARNRGVARALELGAKVILFTDVDCVPDPGWSDAMAAFLDSTEHVAAGGITRSLGDTLLDRYHDFAGSLNGRWLRPGYSSLLYATTCNMAVRAPALARIRFDERFPGAAGEDFDFSHRLRALGTIGLATAAVVRHDFGYASTLRGLPAFARLFRRYGEADPLLWEKHPELRGVPSEACAAADVLAPCPPRDPAAYRRAGTWRLRPRRFAPAVIILRKVARWAYRRGQAAPRPWRAPAVTDLVFPSPTR
jgi:GT2 family glycosyltransferase